MKYAFIREQSQQYPVSRLCQVLNVSTSGYYDWRDRPLSQRAITNQRLLTKIRCFHKATDDVYGSPRIHKDLLDDGEQISRQRVARLMHKAAIQAKTARRFVITTQSKNTHAPAPNHLQRQFSTQRKDQAWVSDTTFIGTRQGWLYLAILLDLYSRKVIGWSMSKRNDKHLVIDALSMATARRAPAKSLIVHSDQGSTYASGDYQKQLKANGMLCSMSRKGECYDNAVAESFFGSLKTEWSDEKDYRTRQQARQSIFDYIEVFYNRKRRHSYLNYVSPVEYERANAL